MSAHQGLVDGNFFVPWHWWRRSRRRRFRRWARSWQVRKSSPGLRCIGHWPGPSSSSSCGYLAAFLERWTISTKCHGTRRSLWPRDVTEFHDLRTGGRTKERTMRLEAFDLDLSVKNLDESWNSFHLFVKAVPCWQRKLCLKNRVALDLMSYREQRSKSFSVTCFEATSGITRLFKTIRKD